MIALVLVYTLHIMLEKKTGDRELIIVDCLAKLVLKILLHKNLCISLPYLQRKRLRLKHCYEIAVNLNDFVCYFVIENFFFV